MCSTNGSYFTISSPIPARVFFVSDGQVGHLHPQFPLFWSDNSNFGSFSRVFLQSLAEMAFESKPAASRGKSMPFVVLILCSSAIYSICEPVIIERKLKKKKKICRLCILWSIIWWYLKKFLRDKKTFISLPVCIVKKAPIFGKEKKDGKEYWFVW